MSKYRNQMYELAEEGLVSWESIAKACLGYMSEADVQDMAECEGFIKGEDE
jgi:hypothetical protein